MVKTCTSDTKLLQDGTKNYITFCKLFTIYLPYFIIHIKLYNWINQLSNQNKFPKIIKGYVASVRSSLVNLGLDNFEIFYHLLLKYAIANIKRSNAEADKRKYFLITCDVFIQLINKFDLMRYNSAALHTAYCLSFAAFLR